MNDLPAPVGSRFRPLRSGLLNLYFYEDEVFAYEQGRLLLRGNNGSGKSRVLALQLPFLLDGNMRPERVEPDGDPAKRIEFHLLMGGRYPDRIGYTWLEFGRVNEDGVQEFRTIGCGLRAVQGRSGATPWFFLTRKRIGQDFSLKPGGAPLTRARLEEALGTEGEVFENASRYREAVDRELFGLGRRYDALIDLLIQLRKPQLSRQLDEERLSGALSEALPPISQDVLADVAEAFNGLERERAEITAMEEAAAATHAFLERYRRYIAVATRRRADDLRRKQSSYETSQKELRTATHDRDAAKQKVIDLGAKLADRDAALTTATEAVRVLEQSPEMRDARALDEARKQRDVAVSARDRARNEFDHAATEHDQATSNARGAATALTERLEQRTTAIASLRGALEEIALGAIANELVALCQPDSTIDARKLRKDIERSVQGRREDLRAIRRLAAEVARCAQAVAGAEARVDEENTHVDEAGEKHRDALATRVTAIEELLIAYDRWSRSLTEMLAEPATAFEDDLADWSVTATGECPVRRAVARCYQPALESLVSARTALQRAIEERAAEVSRLADERMRLETGVHAPPPAPATRDPRARENRDGAPLWAVCDFRGTIEPSERAAFEAALQASGILDAWVAADELVIERADGDVVIAATGAPLARSLDDVLEPALDVQDPRVATLSAARIRTILSRIGTASGEGDTWVDSRGQYQVGALRGGWSKATAEYVGHGARESARRARLAELERMLVDARTLHEAAKEALSAHDARRARLDAELAAAPNDESARAAIDAVAATQRSWDQAKERARAANERLAERRMEHASAREVLSKTARDLGLESLCEDLDAFEERLRRASLAVVEAFGAAVAADTARVHASAVENARVSAEARKLRGESLLKETEQSVIEANARVETLERTVGERVERIVAMLSEARRERARVEKSRNDVDTEHRHAENNASKLDERVSAKTDALVPRTEARDEAVRAFQDFACSGVLALADVADGDDPRRWSATRAVEIARLLDTQLSAVAFGDEAWNRAKSDLNGRFGELDTALGRGAFHPTMIEDAGVYVVRARFHGADVGIAELSAALDREIATRQRILHERERAILEEHLLGEISTHLHDLIRGAEELVRGMNREIESRPMSSGMRIRFSWKPRSDGPAGLEDVRRRLLATKDAWAPEEQTAIGEFLHARIAEVRAKSERPTWQDDLFEAFDYRKWHRFVIEREQDDRWQPLTRRTHGTGSGGEKAIALTLPQVAAASAYYRSAKPFAPRLILLDEVFVGVDNPMRSKCFGLLNAFDLDFVMTSEREWGCYPTIPGLAIYQLTARKGIEAIHAARFVWNGRERVRDEP